MANKKIDNKKEVNKIEECDENNENSFLWVFAITMLLNNANKSASNYAIDDINKRLSILEGKIDTLEKFL